METQEISNSIVEASAANATRHNHSSLANSTDTSSESIENATITKSFSEGFRVSKMWHRSNALTNSTAIDDTEDDDGDDGDFDLSTMASIETRWNPQPLWSIASASFKTEKETPLLTSRECYLGLVDFFQRAPSSWKEARAIDATDEWLIAARLSVMTESSSHITGVRSLLAQPWLYAGGGLGNVDECLSLNADEENPLVHMCMAGGTSRDSLTFASACVVAACSAEDVFADDFPERVASAGFRSDSEHGAVDNNSTLITKFDVEYRELLSEYVTLHKRIAKVGKFLGTGWVCGEYVNEWQPFPSLLWCGVMVLCTLFTILGTKILKRQSHRKSEGKNGEVFQFDSKAITEENKVCIDDNTFNDSSPITSRSSSSLASSSSSSSTDWTKHTEENRFQWFWSAWDIEQHFKRLTLQRNETACLDGLKVGSIIWIIGAHIIALQGSTGAGYLNPKDFFPPNGITTTFFGQLLFSARFAVDTFLCISGYLAAYVLQRKLKKPDGGTPQWVVVLKIVAAIFFRILRILPLYVCCLGFWMFLAPHLGSGPFWYQWEHFLEPCRQLWWTNLLFVNNFLPIGAPTEATCFYHSWYLCVDVQLFCLFAPWLVLVYKSSPTRARKITIGLWLASVAGTALLAYTQEWSVNSFDGYSVAVFDVEGYSKPHVRAQSYLTGIFVAFWPRRQRFSSLLQTKGRQIPPGHRSNNNWLMVLALAGLGVLSFVTVTGAYARRACQFSESPFEGDDCGSLWSPSVNFLYTAFSRAAWSIFVALLLHLCLLDEESSEESGVKMGENNRQPSLTSIIQNILGWNLWTPLAHLSFGAYLIHPIVIYVWFFGGREKIYFRPFIFAMEFCAITVVTFVASFAVTLLVEFPLGILLRPPSHATKEMTSLAVEANNTRKNHDREKVSLTVESQTFETQSYGSLQQRRR